MEMPYRNTPRPRNMREIFRLTSTDDSIQTFQVDQQRLKEWLATSEGGSGEEEVRKDGERRGGSGSGGLYGNVSGGYGGTQVASDPAGAGKPTGEFELGGVETQPEPILADGSAVQGAKGISSSDRGAVRGAKGALPAEPLEAGVDGDAVRGAKGALPAEPGDAAVDRIAVRGAKGAPRGNPLAAAARSEGSEQFGVQGAKNVGSADPSADPLVERVVAGKRRLGAALPKLGGPVLLMSGFRGTQFCCEGRSPRVQGAKRAVSTGLGSSDSLEQDDEEWLEAPRGTTLEVEESVLYHNHLPAGNLCKQLLCLTDARNTQVSKRRRVDNDCPYRVIVGGDYRNLILSRLDAHSLARCKGLSSDCAAMVLNFAFWRLKECDRLWSGRIPLGSAVMLDATVVATSQTVWVRISEEGERHHQWIYMFKNSVPVCWLKMEISDGGGGGSSQ